MIHLLEFQLINHILQIFYIICNSAEDIATINNLETDFEYYCQTGSLPELEISLASFIDSLTQDGNTHLSKNIIGHISYMLKATGYEYMNIKIAVGDSFLAWHIDKSFNEVINKQGNDIYANYSHSFIFTLKGGVTRFLSTDNAIRENFYLMANEYEFTYETEEVDSINHMSSIIEARSAIFMRSPKYGTIHSAPEGKDRVVFVISPLLQTTANLLINHFRMN